MKTNKKAFSIIEVITATIILSIAVFWVFKLISENNKLINNSSNYNTAMSLFIPFQECIENLYKINNSNITNDFYINFWTNNLECKIWNSYIDINNIEYKLNWKIIYENSENINLELNIFTDTIKIKKEYILLK